RRARANRAGAAGACAPARQGVDAGGGWLAAPTAMCETIHASQRRSGRVHLVPGVGSAPRGRSWHDEGRMSIEPPTAAPADLAARVRQLEEALRRQAVLREVMEALAAEPDLDTLFQLVLARITDAMQADRASLFLIDVARGDLWTRITEGDQIREIRLPLGQGIAGHVAATGDTVNIPDAYEDPRFNPSFDRASGYRTRTILCMPLVGRDGARLGAVQVLNKAAGVFTPDDEALLAALGTQVAIAIRNAALLDAQRRETERRALLLDVMRSLSSELELDALLDAIMARTT